MSIDNHKIHFGIILYYDAFRNRLGRVLWKEEKRYFKTAEFKDFQIASTEYTPEKGDPVVVLLTGDNLKGIIPIHDAPSIPWDELFYLVDSDGSFTDRRTNNRYMVVDTLLSKLSDSAFFGFIESVFNQPTKEQIIQTVLNTSVKEVFINTYLTSHRITYDERGLSQLAEAVLRNAIDTDNYSNASQVIEAYSDFHTQFAIEIINRINDRFKTSTELAFQSIQQLTPYALVASKSQGHARFRAEAELSRGIIIEDFSNCNNLSFEDERIVRIWLESISLNEGFLKLMGYLPLASDVSGKPFKTLYYDDLQRRTPLFRTLTVECPTQKGETYLSILLKDIHFVQNDTLKEWLFTLIDNERGHDDNIRLAVSFFDLFPDKLKNRLLKLLGANERKRPTSYYLSTIDGVNIANKIGPYLAQHNDNVIPSKNITDGSVDDYLLLYHEHIIKGFGETCRKYAIEKASTNDEIIAILMRFGLNDETNIEFLNKYCGSELTKEYHIIRSREIIANLGYAVFDLEAHIGEDGKAHIYQAAITTDDGNTAQYSGEAHNEISQAELKSFSEIFNRHQILVGHNIKKWDLDVLKKKRIIPGKEQCIWDTLEVELLLNPTRPSFALNAEGGHVARNDVAATITLFHQQVYAILSSTQRFNSVKEFLPRLFVQSIESNPTLLASEHLIQAYSSSEHDSIFYSPSETRFNLTLRENVDRRILLIAHKRYWNEFFKEYNSICFIGDTKTIDENNELDRERLKNDFSHPYNVYEFALLQVAINSVHLNLSSIPRIVRNNIGDGRLRLYVLEQEYLCSNKSIICVNPDCLDAEILSAISFSNIYILNDFGIPFIEASTISKADRIAVLDEIDEYSWNKGYPGTLGILNAFGIKYVSFKNYWLAQPEPKLFYLLSIVNPNKLKVLLANRYPNINIQFFDCITESAHLDTIDRTDNLAPEEYWSSTMASVKRIRQSEPTVFIVDTPSQERAVSMYLYGENAPRWTVRRILDKVMEDDSYIGVVILDELRKHLDVKFNYSFTFIINDTLLLSTGDEKYGLKQSLMQLSHELNAVGDNCKLLCFKNVPKSESDVMSIHDKEKIDKYFCNQEEKSLGSNDIPALFEWIQMQYHIPELYDIQKNAITQSIVYDGRNNNFLTVVPTGGGKSVIFQGPILYKAIVKGQDKLSIVISPLQALMEDQIDDLVHKAGIAPSLVAYINANTSAKEQRRVKTLIRHHKLALLYIAPERLMQREFFRDVIQHAANDQGIDTIIFDEAHCITTWGMDFRSDYVLALRKCLELQRAHKNIRIQMFTATLPEQAKEELKEEALQFGEEDCNILPERDSADYEEALCPIRDHIDLLFERVDCVVDEDPLRSKLNALLQRMDDVTINNLISRRSRMIVFTRSRAEAEFAAEYLEINAGGGIFDGKVSYYHAGLNKTEKEQKAREYKDGDKLILCATKAFGLGMNIKNIHYVYHLTPPAFIEDYLQEVGRAGRSKTDYSDVFTNKLTGEVEKIKALCFYTTKDLEVVRNSIESLEWGEVAEAYESIIQYIEPFRNQKNIYTIPLNILHNVFSRNTDKVELLKQCLGWLSRKDGLSRVEVGFGCPGVYDLGFTNKIEGINPDTTLMKMIKFINTNDPNSVRRNRVLLRANEVFSHEELEIGSIDELEEVLEEGFKYGVFTREYMYVNISLRHKPYLRPFINGESEELDTVHILCKLLCGKDNNGFVLQNQFDALSVDLSPDAKKAIWGIIKKSWDFFVTLCEIYSIDEIKENIYALIRALGQTNDESLLWTELSEVINSVYDPNKLKLFLSAIHKLGYATKNNSCTDFIELEILDYRLISESEADLQAKECFDSFYNNRELKANAMVGLVEGYISSEDTKQVIRDYSCTLLNNLLELDIIRNSAMRNTARHILDETVKTELNEEQQKIYDISARYNINVTAGAGSGKTRLLIYRALKMILAERVPESRVLILAYNTAVRDEVEKRMKEYARSIRYEIKDAQIYTFHGYAASMLKSLLTEKVPLHQWEGELLDDINNNPQKYRLGYRYILIDEFQDVTTTRLEIIKNLIKVNSSKSAQVKAFVIGDMFQSIYGYEKKSDAKRLIKKGMQPINSIEPIDYYQRMKGESLFREEPLYNNYRSYGDIIKTAEHWFTNLKPLYAKKYEGKLPSLKACANWKDDEFSDGCVIKMEGDNWKEDFDKMFNTFYQRRKCWGSKHNDSETNPFSSIAILFRTNADVYDAYEWILKWKGQCNSSEPIDLLIQGSDIFYASTREFFFFIKRLTENSEHFPASISSVIHAMSVDSIFDDEVLSVVKSLSSFIIDNNPGIKKELFIKQFNNYAFREDSNLKNYLQKQVSSSNNCRIILSTIHRIKGLEFDAVIIPSSHYPIDLDYDDLSLMESIMEERRIMYVAYSRAKRLLFYYLGERENALLNNSNYSGEHGRYYAKDGMAKVNLGDGINNIKQNEYIERNIHIGDSITIRRFKKRNNDGYDWVIYHKETRIGKLNSDNSLIRAIEIGNTNVAGMSISGLKIKSVNVLTKDNDVKYWQEKESDMDLNKRWERNTQGYSYYIDYYGCAIPVSME